MPTTIRWRDVRYARIGPNSATKQLLDLRMADLPAGHRGDAGGAHRPAPRRARRRAACSFPLHFYISDEWFTPDGATAIAIPFYLAHPRLEKLEEVADVRSRRRRARMGHAHPAARSRARHRQRLQAAPASAPRRDIFGLPSDAYPEFYTPKPYSKSFVLHLDAWYAQSHPDEDFAETFAVWLTPNSEWRQRYNGWRALQEARIHGRADAIAARPAAARRQPGGNRAAAATSRRRCGSTIATSAVTTASITRTSTIAICGASSRTRRSSRATSPPRSSSRATAAPSAESWPAGRASTSTRSTRCSRT